VKINIYSIMWNAEEILPYWLYHYETFAHKIFIVDDHSTDLTAEIAKAHPLVEYIPYEYTGLNENEFNQTFYDLYNSNDSDWAIVADQDEFVINPNLKYKRGVLKTEGYTMVSDHLPTGSRQIYNELKMGFRTPTWDKPIIFQPSADILFGDGRHTVNQPSIESDIKLLHYKYLSPGYYFDHNAEGYKRIAGMDDKQWNYRLNRGLTNFSKKLERII